MKLLTRYSLLVLIVVLATACSDNSPSSTESQIKAKEIIKQKQDELGMKHNAMMNWEENFQDQLTVKIQSALKNKTVLFKSYTLEDVFQQGGSWIAKFDGYDGYHLILKTTPNSEVSNRLLSGDLRYKNLSVIVDVKEVTVPHIVLDPQDVDGEYIEIEVSTDTAKLVNGRLVDFIVEE